MCVFFISKLCDYGGNVCVLRLRRVVCAGLICSAQ
jgi:hypothetical protein